MPAVQEQRCGHPTYENDLSFTSRQHQRLYKRGIGRRSETMNSELSHGCNHALRPPSLIENSFSAQEQAMIGHRLAVTRTDFTTPMDTSKLKTSRAATDFTFSQALQQNRFSSELRRSRKAMACPSSVIHNHKQANSIQALPPSYQTKINSVKTKGIFFHKPSTTDQPGTSGNSPKDDHRLVLEPQTGPTSQEQLVAELKGIYTGLTMVEARCIEVDSQQAVAGRDLSNQQPKLSHDQWQALIALHRTLLHEHHDFFLASQHPSASPALQCLAVKYTMPSRMWRHSIHSFLKLLRHRLLDSPEHMLAFISLANSMTALLYETVPTFENTWFQCLGDLGRYRMAIEDEDIRDQDIWSGVARFWYSKASDKSPAIGRLYHHLAILARPNVMQQLNMYTRALGGDLYFKEEDLARQKNDTPFGATGGKIQFSLSISGWTMLWIGSYLGMTAFCSLLALPYGWLLNHLVPRLLYLLLVPCGLGYLIAHCQAIASGRTIPFTSKPGLTTEGVRDTAKSCAPEDKPKLIQKLQKHFESAAATSHITGTDIALKRVDVAGTEVACELGVMGRLSWRLRATVTRTYTLLRGPSLSARLIQPSRTCGLAVVLLSMQHALAMAVLPEESTAVASISNSATGRLTTAKPIRTDFNAPAFSEWSFPILCLVILATCWFFARLKRWEPSNVLGTWAAIYWYLWLYLIRYADISPWYPWSIWSMGTIILLCFIRLGFQKNVLFLSAVTAILVTMGAVRYLPDLRSDHLAAFPPCFNISLAFWIFAVPVLSRTGDSLFHHACHLWDSMGRRTRRVTRRLRVPWHPENELPLHRRD